MDLKIRDPAGDFCNFLSCLLKTHPKALNWNLKPHWAKQCMNMSLVLGV